MKLVFALLRPVYLRYFESTVRLLATRGHRVHLSFSGSATATDDLVRAESLSRDHANVTFDLGPSRSENDPWRLVAGGVRLLGDFGRYLAPPLREATALRRRAERVLTDAVTSDAVPGLARAPLARAVGWLAAHPNTAAARALVGLSRSAERLIPVEPRFVTYLEALAPDAVLVSPAVDFGSDQVEYLKAAHRLGIPAAICVASWDNLTNKGLLRGNPSAVFVWNDIQRREAELLHGIDPKRIVMTGAPRFDEWFEWRSQTTPEEFRARIGLDPTLPHVVYLCSSAFAGGNEVAFVQQWTRALRSASMREVSTAGILVRPHPQNADPWRGARLELDNAVVWPRDGAEVSDQQSKADFYDSIAHSAAVVGRNTSAQIEAAIIGRPVLTIIAPDADGQLGTLHFQYLRREHGGFLIEASSIETHLVQLHRALRGELEDKASSRFVETFVCPPDREMSATRTLVEAIERLVRGVALNSPRRMRTSRGR